MASIERTVYPRFTRAPSVKELREIYTPTPTNVAFVTTKARGPAQKFALMILLKVYERLHYFPDPQSIPGAVIKTLDLRSTTSDQRLLDAMNFIITNEHNPKQYLEATLDLSFASKKWQRTVLVKRKGKSWFRRQHLETCVFSCLADELKTGDICCLGSEQFVDYRNQLLPWSECEPKVAAYCHQLGLPATAKGLVEHVRTWLTEAAAEVDRTRPGNQELMINEKGEPSLKKLKTKVQPAGLLQLEEALHEKIPERHLLDVVVRMERLTGFGRHLGPLSGNEPKMDNALVRQLLALFAYGTNLGPHQMARHLRGTFDADRIAHMNRRHITAEKLDAALRDVKNCFNRYTLPCYSPTLLDVACMRQYTCSMA